MFDRLGGSGLVAGLVLVACICAVAWQGSVVAVVAGVVAAIYVATRLFRSAGA